MKFAFFLLISMTAASFVADSDKRNVQEEQENANAETSTQWAFLVAGSSGWWNYRHQADICHAYQILLKRGIPASNIIVMMYDDVVHDSRNPQPGKLINKPDGPDVYGGVKIDYKSSDVTPKNFLNILSGNKTALKGIGSGRVIESLSKDHVFVNFADHGGSGILSFPNETLSVKDLINTLNSLTKKKKYAKLLLYVEACESGTMFDNILPQHTKILASTSAATDEPSYAYYCYYKDYPCLGDLYSINWMEHLDSKIPETENLFDQYQKIRTLTTKSHVNLYGDFQIGASYTKDFIGPKNEAFDDNEIKILESIRKVVKESGVPSHEVALHWIKHMAQNGSNALERMRYLRMAVEIERKRELVDTTVHEILKRVAGEDKEFLDATENKHNTLNMEMFDCYEKVYHHFSKKCFNMNKNPYVFKHFYKFANICLLGSLDYQEKTIKVVNEVCGHNFPQITDTL